MSSSQTQISVVIPSFNSAKTIGKTLRALIAQQTTKAYEIIVVDKQSTDGTQEIIESFKNRKITLLTTAEKGPAAGRNAGWKRARGEIIIFIDSDCVPHSDWLEKMVAPFDEPKVAAVGGAYETLNKRSLVSSFIGSEIDFRYSRLGRIVVAHGSYSLAVRKTVLEKVGGFSSSFKELATEDWEFTFKLGKSGFLIVFEPAAVVGHYHDESLFKYLKKQFTHAKWRVLLYYLYRKQPKLAEKDAYTGSLLKYQLLLASGVLALLAFSVFNPTGLAASLVLAIVLLLSNIEYFLYTVGKGRLALGLTGLGIQFIRTFVWYAGMISGAFNIIKMKK